MTWLPALTIWQPWATLIVAGAKPFEFRGWPAPPNLRHRRIVIHAGARPVRKAEIAELLYRLGRDGGKGTGLKADIARPILERVLKAPGSPPLGAGLLGEPRRASDIFRGDVADSDRLDHSIWAWPLTDIEPFEPPVPARGLQGFWRWQAA